MKRKIYFYHYMRGRGEGGNRGICLPGDGSGTGEDRGGGEGGRGGEGERGAYGITKGKVQRGGQGQEKKYPEEENKRLRCTEPAETKD